MIKYMSKTAFHTFVFEYYKNGDCVCHEKHLSYCDMCKLLYDDFETVIIVPRVLFAHVVGDTLYYKYYREFTEIQSMTV